MEAKELRIGNLVGYKDYALEVGSLNVHDTEFKELKPIPLTEEWLLKFGFELCEIVTNENITVFPSIKNTFHLYHKDVDHEWFDISVNTRVNKIYTNHTLERIEIKHVHQLQNLYFALTGEELSC